jgi:fatty acid/phospholipid biosynthesis enzyme
MVVCDGYGGSTTRKMLEASFLFLAQFGDVLVTRSGAKVE